MRSLISEVLPRFSKKISNSENVPSSIVVNKTIDMTRPKESSAIEDKKDFSLYYAIRPLYFMSKITGLGPFKMIQDNESVRLITSVRASLYSFLVLLVVTVVLIFTAIDYCQMAKKGWRFINAIAYSLSLIFALVIVLVSIPMSIFWTKSYIIKILHVLRDVDRVLHCETHPVHKKARLIIMTTIWARMIYACISATIVSCLIRISTVAHYLAYFMGHILCMQIICVIWVLKHRFSLVNEQILQIFAFNENEFYYGLREFSTGILTKGDAQSMDSLFVPSPRQIPGGSTYHRLNELSRIHLKLCHIGTLVSSAFGLQILLIFIEALISDVGFIYVAISSFSSNPTFINDYVTYPDVLINIVISVLHISVISAVSRSANCEATRTAEIVHQLLLYHPLNPRLKMFSLQLTHVKLQLSIWGLFPLDSTLMVSFFAGIATYVVIVLEFKDSFQS